MNSTPGICASIMRLIALTPAPPTPTTRITGMCGTRRAVVVAEPGLVAAVGGPLDVEGLVGEDLAEPLLGLRERRSGLLDAIGADPLGVRRLGLRLAGDRSGRSGNAG